MRFYDQVKLQVQSGKWGDGVVSARREAWVPYGWPAWWNGWKWGSVILMANPHINTLIDFHTKKKLSANKGDPWRTKEQYWKQADDLVIQLPLGSIVRDAQTGRPLRHCYHKDDSFLICKGGQWWVGNMHFKNAVNQYPQFALLGEPGEIRDIEIELQLLADVALIGTPSVGKSSLINAVANVKAKVADYPFTTLIPNLWSVKYQDVSFNMVDVPWLIAGASDGKWLWNEFLRHIMKSHVWVFMLDLSRYEAGMQEFTIIFNEIYRYVLQTLEATRDFGEINNISCEFDIVNDNRLALQVSAELMWERKMLFTKDIVFVCNKADVLHDEEVIDETIAYAYTVIYQELHSTFWFVLPKDYFIDHVHTISTYTHQWIDGLLRDLVVNHGVWWEFSAENIVQPDMFVETTKPTWREAVEIHETTATDMPFLIEAGFVDEQDVSYAKVWHIKEREVCRLTYMLPWWNDEAEMRFWNVLDKKRILQKLLTAGLVKWDIIHVQSYYHGVDDRYIRY